MDSTTTYNHDLKQAVEDIKAGRMQAAFDTLKILIKTRPEDGRAWYCLGRIYHVAQKHDHARTCYTRARDGTPAHPRAAEMLAQLADGAPAQPQPAPPPDAPPAAAGVDDPPRDEPSDPPLLHIVPRDKLDDDPASEDDEPSYAGPRDGPASDDPAGGYEALRHGSPTAWGHDRPGDAPAKPKRGYDAPVAPSAGPSDPAYSGSPLEVLSLLVAAPYMGAYGGATLAAVGGYIWLCVLVVESFMGDITLIRLLVAGIFASPFLMPLAGLIAIVGGIVGGVMGFVIGVVTVVAALLTLWLPPEIRAGLIIIAATVSGVIGSNISWEIIGSELGTPFWVFIIGGIFGLVVGLGAVGIIDPPDPSSLDPRRN